MSFTVFLGNLPTWVTADDIKGWLSAENLVADAIKVIRNPETQESKGFAFIEAPNNEEMNSIIRRFDRAPLEDRLLRANPAQPPKAKSGGPPGRQAGPPGAGPNSGHGSGPSSGHSSGHGSGPSSGHGSSSGPSAGHGSGPSSGHGQSASSGPPPVAEQRPPRRANKKSTGKRGPGGPQTPFAEELAKVL
jgi:RNA recognition motif-containing protein